MVYVRPLLEHNTVIWSPHLKYNIEAIERVQRRFTKRLPGLNNYTYSERLLRLGIPTLELRRLRSDLIWCYKIIFGCINVTTREFLIRRSTSTTWGHPYKLYKNHSSCTARSSFFSERVVNIWNSLPADTDFSSLSGFICQINRLDFIEFRSISF